MFSFYDVPVARAPGAARSLPRRTCSCAAQTRPYPERALKVWITAWSGMSAKVRPGVRVVYVQS